MLMSTVVAVSLGLAPVRPDGSVIGDFSAIVGRYSQSIDGQGKTHARGFNRLTGASYDVAMDKDGNVEARVGDRTITFRVREAS